MNLFPLSYLCNLHLHNICVTQIAIRSSDNIIRDAVIIHILFVRPDDGITSIEVVWLGFGRYLECSAVGSAYTQQQDNAGKVR